MASFFGFFPVEDPKVAGIVVLKQPEPVHYGGHTAGPAFRNMAERYANANVEKFNPKSQILAGEDGINMIEIPDFVGQDIALARRLAHKDGINLVGLFSRILHSLDNTFQRCFDHWTNHFFVLCAGQFHIQVKNFTFDVC